MKILITDKVHQLLVEGLKEDGHEVLFDTSITLDQLPTYLPSLDGIIINSKIIMSSTMIDLGPNLKFIARLGSGLEIIDKKYAEAKGIKVINTPDGNCDAVAEHAIGMILSFANNLNKSDREVRKLIWNREENRGFEIGDKTIGIIGMGHTGCALARKLSGFGIKVLGHDKYKSKVDYLEGCSHVIESSLEDIQKLADIISFHLPLSEETHHYASEAFFDKLAKRPLIVNTSRGNVIKTKALISALESQKVSGACLDVFENEKVQQYSEEEKELYKQLFALENTIFSPHIAGWTKESLEKIAKLTLNRIQKTLK